MYSVSCREVGLNCDHVSEGESEEETMKNALQHFWEGTCYKTRRNDLRNEN